eukprot:g13953.t1
MLLQPVPLAPQRRAALVCSEHGHRSPSRGKVEACCPGLQHASGARAQSPSRGKAGKSAPRLTNQVPDRGFVHFSPKSRWKKTHLLQVSTHTAVSQQLDQSMASTPHHAHTSPNTSLSSLGPEQVAEMEIKTAGLGASPKQQSAKLPTVQAGVSLTIVPDGSPEQQVAAKSPTSRGPSWSVTDGEVAKSPRVRGPSLTIVPDGEVEPTTVHYTPRIGGVAAAVASHGRNGSLILDEGITMPQPSTPERSTRVQKSSTSMADRGKLVSILAVGDQQSGSQPSSRASSKRNSARNTPSADTRAVDVSTLVSATTPYPWPRAVNLKARQTSPVHPSGEESQPSSKASSALNTPIANIRAVDIPTLVSATTPYSGPRGVSLKARQTSPVRSSGEESQMYRDENVEPISRQGSIRKKAFSYRGLAYALIALAVAVVVLGLAAALAKQKELVRTGKLNAVQGGGKPGDAAGPTVAATSSEYEGTFVFIMQDYFDEGRAVHNYQLHDDKGSYMRLTFDMDKEHGVADMPETGDIVIVKGKKDPNDKSQKTLRLEGITKVRGPKDKEPPQVAQGGPNRRRRMQAVSVTRTAMVLILHWKGEGTTINNVTKSSMTATAVLSLLNATNSIKDMWKYCTFNSYFLNLNVIATPGNATDSTLDIYHVDVPAICDPAVDSKCPAAYNVDVCSGGLQGLYDTVGYAMNTLGFSRSSWQHVIVVHPKRTACWNWGGLGNVGCSGIYCNTWIPDSSNRVVSTHAHELGHNFGLQHAGTPTSEYGDRSATMGANGLANPCFNGPHAEQLGYLEPVKLNKLNFCPGANYVLSIKSQSETPTNAGIQITPDWTNDPYAYTVQFKTKTGTKYDGTIAITDTNFSTTLAPLGIKRHKRGDYSIHLARLVVGTAWNGITADPSLSITLMSAPTLAPSSTATTPPYGSSSATVKVTRGSSCPYGYYGNTFGISSIPSDCSSACLPNQCNFRTEAAQTGVSGVICPVHSPGVAATITDCMTNYGLNPSATSLAEVCTICAASPTYDPTCSDGYHSQGEDGVDCGGPNCTRACDANGYAVQDEPTFYECLNVTGSVLTLHNTIWRYTGARNNFPMYESSGRSGCGNGICYLNVPTGKDQFYMTYYVNSGTAWCDKTTYTFTKSLLRPYDVTKYGTWKWTGGSPCTPRNDTLVMRPCACFNGAKDSWEAGIDCGGPCTPCTSSCSNGKRDGFETGIDCGGPCTGCTEGKGCIDRSDCAIGLNCSCGTCFFNDCPTPDPCSPNGVCSDLLNDYTCNCKTGYAGIKNCNTDINECASNPCSNGATCNDMVGQYTCTCPNGFTGSNCQTNINECANNPCPNSGACVDGIATYSCLYCGSSPCKNGATCSDTGSGYTCACRPGYEGVNCDNNINECAGVTCQNGGTCVDGLNSYTCSCVLGYNGQHCENEINECSPNPCVNGGTCTDRVNDYSCACVSGYEGKNCATNINDCPNNPSPCVNGVCVDGVNAYSCTCQAGWSGTTCNVNINDCAPAPCAQGTCTDQVNGYTCTCEAGWTGADCNTDINECASNPCGLHGVCNNLVAAYTCTCNSGFTGTNCQTNINDCSATNPCQNGGTCADGINAYTCNCVSGYVGTNCETNKDDCSPDPCNGRGACEDKVNGYVCTCQAGYTGTNCETDINECAANPCLNGASCNNLVNAYSCTCQPGYSGVNCATNINDCSPDPCNGHGTCTDLFNGYQCTCASGWTGATCNQVVETCASNCCLCTATECKAATTRCSDVNCTTLSPGTQCDSFAAYGCSTGAGPLKDCGVFTTQTMCQLFSSSGCSWSSGQTPPCRGTYSLISCNGGSFCRAKAPCDSSPCLNGGFCALT